MFNQQYLICDWWFNVDCSLAESFYSINADIAAEQAANSPDGDAEALPTSYLPSYPDTPPTQVHTLTHMGLMGLSRILAPIFAPISLDFCWGGKVPGLVH